MTGGIYFTAPPKKARLEKYPDMPSLSRLSEISRHIFPAILLFPIVKSVRKCVNGNDMIGMLVTLVLFWAFRPSRPPCWFMYTWRGVQITWALSDLEKEIIKVPSMLTFPVIKVWPWLTFSAKKKSDFSWHWGQMVHPSSSLKLLA